MSDLGSGGGAGSAAGAGAGGGEIHITAGSLVLNGLITADGEAGYGAGTRGGGGGSGGGIMITAGSLSGSGIISAKGGDGGNDASVATETGGGGSGGRIVLTVDGSDSSTVKLRAHPGSRGTYLGNSSAANGAPGSIYRKRPEQPNYDLTIGGLENTVVSGGSTTVTGSPLTVDTFTAVNAEVLFDWGGLFSASSVTILQSSVTVSTFTVGLPGIRVSAGSVLTQAVTAQMLVEGDMTMESGALWRHSNILSVATAAVNIRVLGDLDVRAGSEIALDGLGFSGINNTAACAYGPGAGCNSAANSANAGSGGGHGGFGGRNRDIYDAYRGRYYDSVLDPRQHGSGGAGADAAGDWGGSGGGLALIEVDGTFTLNGLITAKGTDGLGGTYVGGGGSGGTVNIKAASLTGAGSVTVNGGRTPTGTRGGGGAGGRIALVVTDSDSSSLFLAARGGWGATSAGWSGAEGTIYYKKPQDLNGVIIVSSESYTDAEQTVIYEPAELTIDTMTLVSVSFISTQTAITVTSSLTIAGIDQSYEEVSMQEPLFVLGGQGLFFSGNSQNTISTITVNAPAKILSNSNVTLSSVTVNGPLEISGNTGVRIADLGFSDSPSISGTNTLTISTLTTPAALTVPAGTTITQDLSGGWDIGGDFTLGGTLVQNSLGTWHVHEDMTLLGTAVVYHGTNTSSMLRRLNIVVDGDLDIQSGAMVHADYAGFSGGNGPGPGSAGSTLLGGGGGGHGGAGGRGGTAGGGGVANDSFNLPVFMG
ncbi:MAG TPA: hypothetical protein PK523_10050, partial [Elusimicrobiales bacterium]|nr:hypothetical protein [Elusimicrobiales bacterium]